MAMWQRGGNFLHQRLSKLYSDTKQSYEEAKVVPTASPNIEDNPDVIALRKDFTIQQDRLLAWGMHWADVGVHAASSYLNKGQDVNIDKKIDQAGLGDVVASVLDEIKRLLDESGKLQHPERYELNKKPSSPRLQRKEWKEYEVKTGRVLLDQLTSCIDVLYSLVEGQRGESRRGNSNKNRGMSVDEAFGTPSEDASAAQVFSHPLYIDFASLAPMHDPDASAEPPSYDDAQDNSGIKARSIYYYPAAQAHVVVDLVSTRSIPSEQDSKSPLQQLYSLSDKLAGSGLLSWDGHLKLLGFTVAAASSRFGLVYALPAPIDQTALQKYQTLVTTIASSCDHDTSIPPLENKFRLAYNIALLVTGYLAHNSTHGYMNSSNVLFLRETENSRQLGHAVRCPYLLQPIKKVVGIPASGETPQDSMYHHPDADEAGYGAVAAHDIYSVGLVLLELGLWMPIKKFWKAKYDRTLFAERLRRIYSPKLASKCGSRYMKAVQKCLDAPDALVDKTSTLDAAEYLLQVVKDLVHCCALDEDEQPNGLDIEIFEALIDEQKANLPPPDMPIRRKPVPSASVTSTPLDKEPSLAKPVSRLRCRRKYPSVSGHTSPESTALKKFPEVPIPQQHLTEWNTLLMPKLSKILNHALKGSDESASVSLMMLGQTPEQAKTTICIQCTDTTGVRDMLCKRFKPKRGWGVVIVKGEIRRSGRRRTDTRKLKKPKRSAGSAMDESEETKTKQQEYQKRPGPGASIGAFKDGEHLPPVSFGGTILVDGEVYGMTVHHMLDDPSDESDSDQEDENLEDEELEEQLVKNVRRSMAPRQHDETWHRGLHEASKQLGFDDDSFSPEPQTVEEVEFEFEEDYDSDSDASTIRPDFSMLDEDGTEHWFLDDSEAPDLDEDYSSSDDEDDTASVGDIPGIQPYTLDSDDLCITQPAIDDVDEDFFPSLEDRDDDHLASHAFGHVHASSGIKRILAGGLKHEVDWALIRINEDRRHRQQSQLTSSKTRRRPTSRSSTSSSITHSSTKSTTEPTLTSITPLTSLANTRVTCIARTSGPSKGRISPALSLVKLRGRKTASASFTVEGGFGLPGDSGAWIWSEERNELCGHVLAYSHALRQAYMAPMEVLVEDMKRTLEAERVELPGEVAFREKATKDLGTGVMVGVEEKRKGKEVLDVVEGHVEGRETISINRDLEAARELEVALAGLRMDTPTSQQSTQVPSYTVPQSHAQSLSVQQPQPQPQSTPNIQRIDIKPSPTTSTGTTTSTTSSNFSRPLTTRNINTLTATNPSPTSRNTAAGGAVGRGTSTDRSETSRTRKERFDIHVSSGGRGGASELTSLPMARALS